MKIISMEREFNADQNYILLLLLLLFFIIIIIIIIIDLKTYNKELPKTGNILLKKAVKKLIQKLFHEL